MTARVSARADPAIASPARRGFMRPAEDRGVRATQRTQPSSGPAAPRPHRRPRNDEKCAAQRQCAPLAERRFELCRMLLRFGDELSAVVMAACRLQPRRADRRCCPLRPDAGSCQPPGSIGCSPTNARAATLSRRRSGQPPRTSPGSRGARTREHSLGQPNCAQPSRGTRRRRRCATAVVPRRCCPGPRRRERAGRGRARS